MNRPYKTLSITQLEEMVSGATSEELTRITYELEHRARPRAQRLLQSIRGPHSGEGGVIQERLSFGQSDHLSVRVESASRNVSDATMMTDVSSEDRHLPLKLEPRTSTMPTSPLATESLETAPVTISLSASRQPSLLLERRDTGWYFPKLETASPMPLEVDMVDSLLQGTATSIAAAAPIIPIETEEGGHRIRHLFEFIKTWHHLNTPPHRKLTEYQDVHSLRQMQACVGPFVELGTDPRLIEEGVLLRVTRPPQGKPPELPMELKPWVEGELSRPESPPHFRLQMLGADPAVAFDADPRRLELARQWGTSWRSWAQDQEELRPIREW